MTSRRRFSDVLYMHPEIRSFIESEGHAHQKIYISRKKTGQYDTAAVPVLTKAILLPNGELNFKGYTPLAVAYVFMYPTTNMGAMNTIGTAGSAGTGAGWVPHKCFYYQDMAHYVPIGSVNSTYLSLTNRVRSLIGHDVVNSGCVILDDPPVRKRIVYIYGYVMYLQDDVVGRGYMYSR